MSWLFVNWLVTLVFALAGFAQREHKFVRRLPLALGVAMWLFSAVFSSSPTRLAVLARDLLAASRRDGAVGERPRRPGGRSFSRGSPGLTLR